MSYKLAALHFLKEKEVARTKPSQSSRLGLKPSHLVPFPVLGPKREWQSLYLLWLLINPKMCASCRAVCVLSKAGVHSPGRRDTAQTDGHAINSLSSEPGFQSSPEQIR